MTTQIRPVLPSDKPAVVSFLARVWGDHDYLPQVWDEWLADPRGVFLVALVDGVPAGVVRGVLPAPDEGWLEGMRVDPDYRRNGIAQTLTEALMEACRERGARVARLMTAWDNVPVHTLCAKMGFTRLLRLRRRFRPLQAGERPAALRQLGLGEEAQARDLLARRGLPGGPAVPWLTFTHGLYSLSGGLWTAWTEERLREHLSRGEVWGWTTEKGLQAVAVVCPHRRRAGTEEVGLAEGSSAALGALLGALVYRPVLPGGEPMVRLYWPLELPRLQRAAAAAGFRVPEDAHRETWLFEKEM